MKRRVSKVLSIFLVLVMTLGGCGANEKEVDTESKGEGVESSDTINVWSYFGGFEQAKNELKREENGNIKVEINKGKTDLNYSNYVEEFLKIASTDEVPDVIVIDSNDFGMFNDLDIFEDLFEYKSEYIINKECPEDFNKVAWEMGKSFDGEKMIAMAYASAPVATYYRQDIFSELGIGNTPEEVGASMKSIDGWKTVAKKLFDNKQMWLTQFVTDPLVLFSKQYSPFNSDMEFQYTKDGKIKEEFKNLLTLSKYIYNEKYALKEDFFANPDMYLNDENFAMLHMAPWGSDYIKKNENQKGKWAVTSLPFGINGWNNSTMFLIPKNSKNKEDAWKFIEYVTFKMKDENPGGSVYSYKPVRSQSDKKSDFLANEQMEQKLYEELLDNNETNKFMTPLDEKVFDIWVSQVNNGIENGKPEKDIIDNINDAIKLNLQDEIDILKESLQKNKQ